MQGIFYIVSLYGETLKYIMKVYNTVEECIAKNTGCGTCVYQYGDVIKSITSEEWKRVCGACQAAKDRRGYTPLHAHIPFSLIRQDISSRGMFYCGPEYSVYWKKWFICGPSCYNKSEIYVDPGMTDEYPEEDVPNTQCGEISW